MPAKNEIQTSIELISRSAQDAERRKYLKKLHQHTKRNVVVYASAFGPTKQGVPPSLLSILPDDVQGFMAAFHGLPAGRISDKCKNQFHRN